MAKCPKCGTDAFALAETRGHLEKFVCSNCGCATWATVYRASEASAIDVEKNALVLIRWSGAHATVSEIRALRELVPEFRDIRVSELMTTVGRQATVALGPFTLAYANEVKTRASAKGLLVAVSAHE